VHIPIASITSCRVMNKADQPVRGREGYYPKAGGGILLDWRDEHGKERKALLGSDDPAALVASIERARSAADPKVRVASTSESELSTATAEEEAVDEAKVRER
jgi:hypothetical protein